jgi:hypothetical protein
MVAAAGPVLGGPSRVLENRKFLCMNQAFFMRLFLGEIVRHLTARFEKIICPVQIPDYLAENGRCPFTTLAR